ncbi:hypothetical protein IAT38_000922 [Cryptococcus sp. DSM 104549]
MLSPTPLIPAPNTSCTTRRQHRRASALAVRLAAALALALYVGYVVVPGVNLLGRGAGQGKVDVGVMGWGERAAQQVEMVGDGFRVESPDDDAVGAESNSAPQGKGEAYVTFLSSISDPWYLTSTRLLLYQLRHSPPTSSPRPFVVITTSQIPASTEAQLRREGAVVKRVELLDGFPVPTGIAGERNHHWKDQYTKLHIFNLTEFDRVLYLDNDMLLLQPLDSVWDAPEAQAELAGVGERSKKEAVESDARVMTGVEAKERDYLNAGFMLLKPSEERFEELRGVRGYEPFYMEQALLNHYYDWEGKHPWVPLNDKFVSHFPKKEDISSGYHSLHAKMWKDAVDSEVVELWEQELQNMEAYWAGRT